LNLFFKILHHILINIVLHVCFQYNYLIIFYFFCSNIFRYSILSDFLMNILILFVKKYFGYKFIFCLISLIIRFYRFFILYLIEPWNLPIIVRDKIFLYIWTTLNAWIIYNKQIFIILLNWIYNMHLLSISIFKILAFIYLIIYLKILKKIVFILSDI